MKTRLLLFLAGSAFWAAIYSWIFAPTSVLIRQSAAVATVKNSNAAYVAQQAAESSLQFPWFATGLMALFLLCFTRPILNAFKAPSQS